MSANIKSQSPEAETLRGKESIFLFLEECPPSEIMSVNRMLVRLCKYQIAESRGGDSARKGRVSSNRNYVCEYQIAKSRGGDSARKGIHTLKHTYHFLLCSQEIKISTLNRKCNRMEHSIFWIHTFCIIFKIFTHNEG